MQTDCVGKAVAAVGALFTNTFSVELLLHSPFTVRQRKTLFPKPIAVTLVVTALVLLIDAEPDIRDQVPGPRVGAAAESTVVGLLIQMV